MKTLYAIMLLISMSFIPVAHAEQAHELTALDLAAHSDRWNNKLIQIDARCFMTGKNDYRCITDVGTRIDLNNIGPLEAQEVLERDCNTLSKMMDTSCVFTIQFVYQFIDMGKYIQNRSVYRYTWLDQVSIAKNKTAQFIRRQICKDDNKALSCLAP